MSAQNRGWKSLLRQRIVCRGGTVLTGEHELWLRRQRRAFASSVRRRLAFRPDDEARL